MSDVVSEIGQLARQVNHHADDPWLECDGCVWVRLEHVVAIEPVDGPV